MTCIYLIIKPRKYELCNGEHSLTVMLYSYTVGQKSI